MITNHCVSLELAKELVAAGVVIESEFIWVISGEWPNGEKFCPEVPEIVRHKLNRSPYRSIQSYPAPLASELTELLPQKLKISNNKHYSQLTIINMDKDLWDVDYYQWGKEDIVSAHYHTLGKTQIEALAKMLLFLKKQGLLPQEKI